MRAGGEVWDSKQQGMGQMIAWGGPTQAVYGHGSYTTLALFSQLSRGVEGQLGKHSHRLRAAVALYPLPPPPAAAPHARAPIESAPPAAKR